MTYRLLTTGLIVDFDKHGAHPLALSPPLTKIWNESVPAAKVANRLAEFEIYIKNNCDQITPASIQNDPRLPAALVRMGLVPKQHSIGGKSKLAGISKRGNRYPRKILIHGASTVVLRSKRERIAMGAWMTALDMRVPRNVLIATANKPARIEWVVLSSGKDHRAVQDPVPA